MSNIIALLTDFGDKDGFTGTVKGVIYTIAPEVKVVDITHHVNPQDINAASWILASSYKYFPAGTIFVCVVDPGVGSSRKQILVKIHDYYFIGPDNGFLTRIINDIDPQLVISLDNPEYWLNNVKQTFHGRDIFGPVAAYLAKSNKDINTFGTQIPSETLIRLQLHKPYKDSKKIYGSVVYVDHFGNLVTDIPDGWITNTNVLVSVGRAKLKGLQSAYSNVDIGQPMAIIGSDGFLEVSINCGNAAQSLEVSVNERVVVELP